MIRTKVINTLVFILLALVLGAVIASGTPAGTQIHNQASASYVDSAGQPQTTTSNEVIVVVQPVYGLEIKPDGDEATPGQIKEMLAAGTVYFNWAVKNTGNTNDTYTLDTEQGSNDNFDFDVQGIYLDENCNGQIDPGEAAVNSVSLAADETACIIVEAKVNGTANNGNSGNLNLKGASNTDGNITDNNNWAQAVITEDAILDAVKSASPSGVLHAGDAINYTISGSNIGGSDAYAVANVVTLGNATKNGILVSDEIPTNTTYVANSAAGTAGAGTATVIFQTANGWTASEPAASDVTAVGLLIEDPNYDPNNPASFFPQSYEYQLSFSVTVDSGALAGDDIPNVATVKYGTANGDKSIESNTTHNRVAADYGVANGPNADPEAASSSNPPSYTDPSGKTWDYDHDTGNNSSDNDYEHITNDVYGGDTVYFKNTLKNTGNGEDSYDLTLDGVPSDWTCQFMAADGTTPLSNPVGTVAANSSLDYIVKCSIPPSTTTSNATDLTITVTSKSDPAVSDTTHDVIPPVKPGYGVDAAKPGETADGDNTPADDNPPAQTTDPGTSVQIPFEVANTGHNPDTYDLGPTLPNGWSGTIYPEDCNGDGQLDDPRPAPVTDTGLIEAGEKKCFILVVDVPEGQDPVTLDENDPTDDNVKVAVTSHADPNNSTDAISTDVNVNEKVNLEFSPDHNGTVTSPGNIIYKHTLTNSGNIDTTVNFSESGSTHPNWTYEISTDGGNTWTPIAGASTSLSKGESKEVQIRVSVPAGEPIGAIDTNEIAVSTTYTAGGETKTEEASVTDTTTVVGGDLRLEKSAQTCETADCSGSNDPVSNDGSVAKPGEYIQYTVIATNIGTANLPQVIITDPLPAYTDFESVSGSTSVASPAQVLYSTDGDTWSTTPPSELAAGQTMYIGLDQDGDGDIDTNDNLPPGETLTMVFTVKVQEDNNEQTNQNAP